MTDLELLVSWNYAKLRIDCEFPESQQAQEVFNAKELEVNARGLNPYQRSCKFCYWWSGRRADGGVVAAGNCRQRGPFANGFPVTQADDFCPEYRLPLNDELYMDKRSKP